MSQPTEQRPPQVSLASSIIMFASFLVLATAWERVTTLGSLETQQAIEAFLADPPFSSLGLDVDGASQVLRIACLVAAACACATGILGWYVRKPDRPARLALTLFAVPVFVTGLPVSGLAGSFVAAGAAMLWMSPARQWFATGRWTPPAAAPDRDREPARRTPGLPGPVAQPPSDRPPSDQASPPPATRPFGEPHASASQAAPPPARDAEQRRLLLHQRPGAMVAAFVLTVVMAGGLLALSLLWVAIAGLSPDFLMSVLEQQPDLVGEGLTLEEVRRTVYTLAGAFIVWCVAALVFAGFAMARHDWARRALMAIAALSAGGCLAFVVDVPLVVVPAAAAVATVVCLRRVEVRRWFSLESR